MKIVGASWSPIINYYKIQCSCGNEYWCRVDRWITGCPKCGRTSYIDRMRDNLKTGDIV